MSYQEWPVEIRLHVTDGVNDMDKEELAATETAKRAFRAMDDAEEKITWSPKDTWLEATKLVVWVLRGCRG